MARLGGVGTLSVTAAVAIAGLVLLQAGGAVSGTPATPPSTGADVAVPDATTTTMTIATTTTPVGPITVAAAPATMTIRRVTVGVNGSVRLSGSCPTVDGLVLGPVEIWSVGDQVVRTHTGITAGSWTYDWRAPTTADPMVLQVWCGDPTPAGLGFPSGQEIVVVVVAQQQPAITVAPGTAGSGARDPLPGTA